MAGQSSRVADSTPSTRHQDLLFLSSITVILLLGGFLFWQWSQGSGGELQVRARTFPVTNAAGPAGRSSPIFSHTSAPAVVAIIPDNAPGAAATSSLAQPVTYKLQSIVYVPGNPSAVINGKVVHVNSLVNDARVVAIRPGAATIVTADGQTNVLVMPEELR